MAAVPAQIPDQFGPGPIEGSVLRFLQEHRSCAVWEGKVKLKPTTCLIFSSYPFLHYVDFFFLPISKILSLLMVLLALNT